ncbi:MAG: sigma-70 family RNA polymerase sigma factor, partial [Clostridia bacterium]|nr:sigma-70 family RNA polymerase sigma factor [Clostridia bacterium]
VNENSPLIKSVIKIYRNKGVEYDDLFQLGCLGFVKAINNFNESFGVKFSTYAVPMIAGEVKRFLRDDGSIKVSRALKTLNIQIEKYIQQYRQNHIDSPSIAELSKHFGVDEEEIVYAMDSRKALLSLDDKQDETNPNSRTIMESIEDVNHTDNFIDNIVLKDLIKELPDKDKKILALRYFEDKTQSEIAGILNVSQVQVSRLENKIINKLKNKFKQ